MSGEVLLMHIAMACLVSSCTCQHRRRPTWARETSPGSFVSGLTVPARTSDTVSRLQAETVANVTRPTYVTTDTVEYNVSPTRTLFPVPTGTHPTTVTLSPSRHVFPEIRTLRKPKHLDSDEFVTELPVSQTSGYTAQAQRNNSTEETDDSRTTLKKLFIGGLFDLSGGIPSSNDQSELAAALLALRHINDQRYVPGYQLELVYNDTKCDPGYGAEAFYDLIYRKQQLIMLVATSCSEVAKTLGEIVSYWNLLLVS
ncbi:hypothetical protein LSAT2_008979, partial [Lamellibrachia satsuma]